MYLRELNILNFKNIEAIQLTFSEKINCFIGQNGMGKTNTLDAIYLLSFCKSSLLNIDSQCIRHNTDFAMVQGIYSGITTEDTSVVCGLKRGQKKQFRLNKKDYQRLTDHIGLIPLVFISPEDQNLIVDGSDERRKFIDSVISQTDKSYLQHLVTYNALLKQRNALLKQEVEATEHDFTMFEVIEKQMALHAQYIYEKREQFVESFIPIFQEIYNDIAQDRERVSLRYRSQLQDRDLSAAFVQTRSRDLILGWTSQGIHKDDLEMQLADYPLKQVGSQGQQKTYTIALKMAQAIWLTQVADKQKPILLLDDVFDRLDAQRVQQIVKIVHSDNFGQIFITDTNRTHLSQLIRPQFKDSRIFQVEDGNITEQYE